MTLDELLAKILNPNPGGNMLAQAGAGYLPQTGLSPDMVARQHAMSGIAAPQAGAMPSPPPQAAPAVDRSPVASVGYSQPSGGGIFSRLFGGGRNADIENQTAQWLVKQGYDPEIARGLAADKEAMQKIFIAQGKGGEGFSLSPGEQRYDANGNLIATGAQKPEEKTRLMTPDEVKAAGLPFGSYQIKSDGTINEIGGSGSGIIQEYLFAKGQGFPGTLADWEASKKGGMSLEVNPDGTVTLQQGSNIKPLTESQSKDTYFATRAGGAAPIIDKYGDALTDPGMSAASSLPLVGNYLKSDQYQQAEQAGREFLQAILRKESGAAISIKEETDYGDTFLPRPGDGAPVLAQKRAARQRAIDALKAGMTPQAILAQEKALQSGQPRPAVEVKPAGVYPDGGNSGGTGSSPDAVTRPHVSPALSNAPVIRPWQDLMKKPNG